MAVVDPVPAAEATDAGRVGVELFEEGLDLGDLVVEGGVDAAFDVAADLLEEALGRVQLRAVGRQADERQVEVGDVAVAVAGGVVPDEPIEEVRPPGCRRSSARAPRPSSTAPSSTRPARPARRRPRTGSATRT